MNQPASPMRAYSIEQMNRLLTNLAFQLNRAIKNPSSKEIHDLRVSIRRFVQGLRMFAEFFSKPESKHIRRSLKRVMRLTSEIRNRDITIEFLGRSGEVHVKRLEKERMSYQRELVEVVRRWNERGFSAKWRDNLHLDTV